jgi:thymidylate synthase
MKHLSECDSIEMIAENHLSDLPLGGRAAVPNMYGLARLMEHVGQAVGVPIGSLTIVAASGHVYQD